MKLWIGALASVFLSSGIALAQQAPAHERSGDAAAPTAPDGLPGSRPIDAPPRPKVDDRASNGQRPLPGEASDLSNSPTATQRAESPGPGPSRAALAGTLESVHGNVLKIDGEARPLYVGRGTAVLRDGKVATLRDLQPGDEIRAGYDVRGTRRVATQVSADSSPQPGNTPTQPAGASGSHGPQDTGRAPGPENHGSGNAPAPSPPVSPDATPPSP